MFSGSAWLGHRVCRAQLQPQHPEQSLGGTKVSMCSGMVVVTGRPPHMHTLCKALHKGASSSRDTTTFAHYWKSSAYQTTN